jgi:hypothetical protein
MTVPLSADAARRVDLACRSLANVDLARLPKTMPDLAFAGRLHREAGTAASLPQADRADILLKVAVQGGGVGMMTGISAWAAKQPDGTWRAAHVQRLLVGPPPQPPGTPPLPMPPTSVVKTGRLKPEAAQLIDAALASSCLGKEPFLLPSTLPMKNGTDMHCPPDGGSDNALEIVERGKSRRYLRECSREWSTGTIIIALENPANLMVD